MRSTLLVRLVLTLLDKAEQVVSTSRGQRPGDGVKVGQDVVFTRPRYAC